MNCYNLEQIILSVNHNKKEETIEVSVWSKSDF